MGSHRLNLTVRFVLELIALVALGRWGWQIGDGVWRLVLMVTIPLIAAGLWGTSAVPDDPSRSGKALVQVSGATRLAIELGIFALATWAVYQTSAIHWSWTFGIAIILHYLVSYDRILWLIRTNWRS
jgi:hypothetical protein